MRIMRDSPSPQLFFLCLLLPLLLHHLCPAAASPGSDFDHEPLTRFVCTPIPVDADPSCFPSAGPSSGATPGPSGSGRQSSPNAGWYGASEEAKATILHQRESLVQQKETILDQRETIRELTAKLALCEGLGRGVLPHNNQHSTSLHPHHPPSHHTITNSGHSNNQPVHHGNGNLIPDSPHHHPSVGVQRLNGGHSSTNPGKDKHGTSGGDMTSSPEQMERMLQALKDRLENLQKRNSSIAYSSSLKELLQRKIDALEEQLHHHTSDQDHHHDDSSHAQDHYDDHHDDHNDHPDDEHAGDHKDHEHDSEEHHEEHNSDHTEHDEDSHSDEHHEDGDDDDEDDGSHHSNEAESHSYLPHTGYRAPGPRAGFYPNKLETVLNQLHLTGSSGKKPKGPDAFMISFPMRTNYMHGRVRRTLLQEIFALTLCMWIKAGSAPGLGTPFSYSAPGQSNELVLIEWGNNPLELLIDDKAVTLPLTLSDGKWHHICVTWSTRDGHWEAYQDGTQRGSGMNLSPWHPIKPGGVFILGQEQDTLGGRFDAAQSFVGEMSEVNMWSHVLSSSDIYSLSSCSSHLRGDLIAWSDTELELHGGLTKYPSETCH
ncbi:neuronal pentraxin-2-like [Gouania willdenowi]|uniref:Neuronal pentraxin-2-like n=1 Tax=Gouania willdenowi TaxID=441366 RepID=A0A8C5E450_GOUWI|nr:neuronal pentraxin-2-like [Gouania willdenowi]XP_028326686.1 neuronal pentraxin-2-like [Gouania willdenowi]